MPSTLMCRCTPIRSNQRRNSASLAPAGPPPARAAGRGYAAHPADHARARPGDVAVLQQRHQVVADRAAQRVLEIDDAGIALGDHHEIARVIVAVHEHLRLRQRLARSGTRTPPRAARARAPTASSCRCRSQKPLGHQRHLARERAAVIGRELRARRAAAQLDVRRAPRAHRRTARSRIAHRARGARDTVSRPRSSSSSRPRATSASCTCGTCTPQRLEQRATP